MKLRDVNPKNTVLDEQILDEINMSPSSLKQLAGQINARAGMEFEMIVPGAQNDDGDMEPDYDSDERTRSFSDIQDFFHDGDYNGRREVERLIEKLQERFWEWESEKVQEDWGNDGEDYLRDYITNNEWDEDEKIREHLESMGLDEEAVDAAMAAGKAAPRFTKASEQQAAREADENYNNYLEASDAADEELDEYVESEWGGQAVVYDEAYEQYSDEQRGNYDEGDFLEDAGLTHMSDITNEFDISWPHYTTVGGGELSVEQVASEFEGAIGRSVKWSNNYHGGKRDGTSYVVEPDSSLDPDDSNDGGLEFVSPPLPVAELISDLDKVAKWAGMYGAYTNQSTGLHINVSVDSWNGDMSKLDYVKLALLLGDNYILDKFGRAGNTYCKSAMNEIKNRVGQRPEDAGALLQKMKTGLDSLASKAIHSGVTSKYTSINTKEGYIEFRSPGGDWLGEYAADTGAITNTLLRFVVALDAAVDPEKYKQEYLKKLYAILQPKTHDDTMAYFAQYAAGQMPKAALKSFIKQAQLERKNVKDTYKELTPAATVAPTTAPTTSGEFTGQWIIKDGSGRELYRFGGIGNNQSDANRRAIQWLTQNGYGHGTEVEVVPEMR